MLDAAKGRINTPYIKYNALNFQTFRPAVVNWAHSEELRAYHRKIIVNIKDNEGFQTASFPGLVGYGEEQWNDAEEDARRRKLVLNIRKEGAYIGIAVYLFYSLWFMKSNWNIVYFATYCYLLLGESNADLPRRNPKPALTKGQEYFILFNGIIRQAQHLMRTRGYPEDVVNYVWDLTVNFGSYNVPPHSDEPHRDGPGDVIFNICIRGDGLLVFTVTSTLNLCYY